MTKGLVDVADLFMGGEMLCGPYWGYLEQAWRRRGHPNLHIMFYEDMKGDVMGELRRLRDFLQMDLSEDQLARWEARRWLGWRNIFIYLFIFVCSKYLLNYPSVDVKTELCLSLMLREMCFSLWYERKDSLFSISFNAILI